MKTIGLIGGMSWESTVTYYQVVNEVIKKELGGLHSARCILYSVDFEEIEACQSKGEWEKSGQILLEAARSLERAGADFIVICTNTMHKVVPQIKAGIKIPILHIAEATARQLKACQIDKVALLGTKYTMEQAFYKQKLMDEGIDVIVPDQEGRSVVNRVIYEELCLGKIVEHSKKQFLAIIDQLAEEGAQGIILGCTEIGLLVHQEDTKVPLFDTTLIHATAAAKRAIE